MSKPLIILIGNKCRQGKDVTANKLHELIPNSKILHWADALYEECRNNEDTVNPLIYRVSDGFMVKDKGNRYMFLSKNSKHKKVVDAYNSLNDSGIMSHINDGRDIISAYYYMGDKDVKLLQWWGTNYRRNLYFDNYWVDQVDEVINTPFPEENIEVFIIPDTRFKNEYYYKQSKNGIFIKVERYNEDGTRFISDDRDPNHISETDLDDIEADYSLINNRDLKILEHYIETDLLEFIKNWN